MVTAELAVAFPAVVLVLVLALSAVAAVADEVRCLDAARAVARSLARGDPEGDAVGLGRRLAPGGAEVAVRFAGSTVEVTVSGAAPAPLRWLGARASPRAEAVAVREDTP